MRRRSSERQPAKGTHTDTQRVTAAGAFIREHMKEADSGLRAIGEHLLDEFFGGDPETYEANRRTHAGLRMLLKGAGTIELPVSKTALSNAVGVAVVARKLGAASVFSRLPQSLAVELLPLRDVDAIELLAAETEALVMTVQDLRRVVRDMTPKSATGRPRKPRLIQAVEALVRVLGDGPSCRLELGPDDVAALDPEPRERARIALGHMREHLARIHDALTVPAASSDVGTVQGGDSRERRSRLADLASAL